MSEEATPQVEAPAETPATQETPAEQPQSPQVGTLLGAAATPETNPEASGEQSWISGGKFTQAFYDQFGSDEVRPVVEKYQGDPAKMVRALSEGQKLIGKRLGIPQDDSDPASLAKFREVNGIPAEPNGYNVQAPAEIPEGVEFNVDTFNAEWAPLFHKLNLAPWQVKALVEKDIQMHGGYAKANREAEATRQQEHIAAQAKELKEAFGNNYNDNIALAQRAIATFGDGTEVDDPQLANSAKFIKFAAKVAASISQDKLVPPASVQTAQSLGAQARDIMTNPANSEHSLYKGQTGSYADQQAVRKKVRDMLSRS